MKRLYPHLIITLLLLLFGSRADAGCFHVLMEDEHTVMYQFHGVVERGDEENLNKIAFYHFNQEVHIMIDSPGGCAWTGINLYWAAKEHEIITHAGTYDGAWSAAALFWMGGQDYAHTVEGSMVGWHLAYCPWLTECDTSKIDGALMEVLVDCFGREQSHIMWCRMMEAFDQHGTQGFVVLRHVKHLGLLITVENPSETIFVHVR